MMNEAQIDDLKHGLKFGKAIELPRELMLSARQMCDMLVERETNMDCMVYRKCMCT